MGQSVSHAILLSIYTYIYIYIYIYIQIYTCVCVDIFVRLEVVILCQKLTIKHKRTTTNLFCVS